MFKFDFCDANEPNASKSTQTRNTNDCPESNAGEVQYIASSINDFSCEVEDIKLSDVVTMKKGRLSASKMAELLNMDDVNTSDLVPGEYEGGFKLWEGAIDLSQYLLQFTNKSESPICSSSTVLEIGCGHGLPGIVCLIQGATVHFQDFNRQVLTELTTYNIHLATSEDSIADRVRLFYGEFNAVAELLKRHDLRYDYVLASEILYNSDAYASILSLLFTCLKPTSAVFIATKVHYFGVGGSLVSFTDFVRRDGRFDLTIVWQNQDSSNGRRVVVKLTANSVTM